MGTQSFGGVVETLSGIDFFSGILPFVITYTVFFFILRYIAENVLFEEWSDSNKPDQFAAILAIAFAFFTADFILAQPWAATFFSEYLGRLTLIIVGLIGLLAMLGFVGMDLNSRKTALGAILSVVVLAVFAVSGGVSSLLPSGSQNQAIALFSDAVSYSINSGLIFILLIIGLLYYTMRDPDPDGGDSTPWFTPWGTPAPNPNEGGEP